MSLLFLRTFSCKNQAKVQNILTQFQMVILKGLQRDIFKKAPFLGIQLNVTVIKIEFLSVARPPKSLLCKTQFIFNITCKCQLASHQKLVIKRFNLRN